MIIQPFGFLAPTAAGVEIVTQGLYNHLNIADASSYPGTGTTVTNIGITGSNDGTLNGSYTYNSSDKSVEVGNGTPDGNIARTTDPVQWGTDFTMEIGFKFVSGFDPQTTQVSFMNVRNTSTYAGINRPGYFFSNLRFVLQGVAAYTFPGDVTGDWQQNTSFQCVAVAAGTNLKIYTNGVEQWSTTISSTRPENNPAADTTRYGCFASGTTIPTGAREFDFYFWRDYNRALSADEVLQNYNASKSILGH